MILLLQAIRNLGEIIFCKLRRNCSPLLSKIRTHHLRIRNFVRYQLANITLWNAFKAWIKNKNWPFTVGWVNLYQKFEIEKYTVCGKLILPKKWKGILNFFFWHNWLANLHGFANISKLTVSNTFKDMQSKIWSKVVLLKYFKFCYYKYCKRINF